MLYIQDYKIKGVKERSLLNAELVRKLLVTFVALLAPRHNLFFVAGAAENIKSAVQQQPGAPRCDVKGSTELTITCDYFSEPNNTSPRSPTSAPCFALDHASFSFDTSDDGHMKIGLTITNHGAAAIADSRTVYISIDDARGKNYMRRPLPHIDLRKIAPQQTLAFSETLLSPAFSRGTYTIHLWIPSPDESLKFIPSHNLLLANIGVPDPATGLNALATFGFTGGSGGATAIQEIIGFTFVSGPA